MKNTAAEFICRAALMVWKKENNDADLSKDYMTFDAGGGCV